MGKRVRHEERQWPKAVSRCKGKTKAGSRCKRLGSMGRCAVHRLPGVGEEPKPAVLRRG